MIVVNPYSVEKESHTVRIDADPSGDVPRYAFLPRGDRDPTGQWVDGEWDGSFTAGSGNVLGTIEALTPTLGSSSAQVELTDGQSYSAWVEITVAGQVIVEVFDEVRCQT